MKKKLVTLTVLGALVALAVPAGALATTTVTPAGAKFETPGPTIRTSLGSCSITKLVGSVPKAPENTGAGAINSPIETPTVSGCTSGTTMTLSGSWTVVFAEPNSFTLANPATEAVTMRFSSLPGCKLSGNNAFQGIYSNGVVSPFQTSRVHFNGERTRFFWSNDGGTCAMAGKAEVFWWSTPGEELVGNHGPLSSSIANLTTPTTPIVITK